MTAGEEQTVTRIRIHRHMIWREHPWHDVFPPDARDPDVIRAKALARAGDLVGRTTARQHGNTAGRGPAAAARRPRQ
jgi:hypothetical protein